MSVRWFCFVRIFDRKCDFASVTDRNTIWDGGCCSGSSYECHELEEILDPRKAEPSLIVSCAILIVIAIDTGHLLFTLWFYNTDLSHTGGRRKEEAERKGYMNLQCLPFLSSRMPLFAGLLTPNIKHIHYLLTRFNNIFCFPLWDLSDSAFPSSEATCACAVSTFPFWQS